MRLLVVHLSDIHIASSADPVLQRGKRIVDAVKNLDYELDAALLIVSGDIANTGDPEQYELARDFLEGIRRSLETELLSLQGPVALMVSPGNHDCLFPIDTAARDVSVDAVVKDPTRFAQQSIANVCTEVHEHFFDFRDAAACTGLVGTGRIFYEYNVSVGSERIHVCCYNTACTSRKHESPGGLVFPVEQVQIHGDLEGADLVLSLLHHPNNWFAPENARKVATFVDLTSDIVLTGHEHVQSRRSQTKATGEATQYIEGGVLQSRSDSNSSAFNAFVVDTNKRVWKNWHFSWKNTLYQPDRITPPDWENFNINPKRSTKQFTISASIARWLDDPGINLTHRDRGKLKLSDVYVYPDLKLTTKKVSDSPSSVKSDDVSEHIYKIGHVFISGDERAGKTSFAKRICLDLHARGCVPVLLDGASLNGVAGDKLYGAIEHTFSQWYSDKDLEHFRQLDRDRRLIVIDDFDLADYGKSKLPEFLRDIGQYAAHVVIVGAVRDPFLFEVARHEAEEQSGHRFVQYSILDFGHRLRGEMIKKWFALSERNEDLQEYTRRVSEVEAIADTVLVKGVVPVHPVYLLAVLQAQETATPMDLRASTHGVLYETFITAALYGEGTATDYNIKAGYLALFAYTLFADRKSSLNEQEFFEFHQEYQRRYDMPQVNQRKMSNELVRRNILVDDAGDVWFKYRYMYYYFVAAYLRDHISEENVRKQINTLAHSVYLEDNANIMLFLAHLSKDPLIISEMMEGAKGLLVGVEEARLEQDVDFLREETSPVAILTYVEKDVLEGRRERAEHLDRIDEERGDTATAEMRRENRTFQHTQPGLPNSQNEFDAAFKTLQILGQILKNFPGTLEAELKTTIATICYSLGLRIVSKFLDVVRKDKDLFMQEMMRFLRHDFPDYSAHQLENRAWQTLYILAHGVVIGMVKQISRAVGSPELRKTYKNVLALMRSPAVVVIDSAISLAQVRFKVDSVIDVYIELDGFPLARSVLQYLVVEHLYLFPMDRTDRERVCKKLEIPIQQSQLVGRSRMLKSSS